MPFGCSASLRSLSCCLQFLLIPHGSYCVLHATSFISSFVPLHYTTFAAKPFAPRQATVSFTPLRSFLPSFRFITPRSQLNHLLQGRASQATHKAIHMGMHLPFRKPSLQYSLGFIPLHYVIHSLQ